jgi:hypothetical protein
VALAAQQAAIGDDLEAGRGRDHEGVGRLVDRVVVDREPAGGDLGLAGDDRAVVVWMNPASRMKPGPISISWVIGTPS